MKKIFLLILVVCSTLQSFSQHEVGLSLGASNLLGDFGGGPGVGTILLKDIDFKSTRPAFGLFYRYNFPKNFSLRAQFLYTNFYSNDLYSEDKFRKPRALSSKSTVLDGSLQVEYNFMPLDFCSGKASFSPYIATGIALTSANAKVSSANSEVIANSENQYIKSGSILVVNVPFSFGVKYKSNRNILLALDASYRMAFTDRFDNYVRQENDQFVMVSAHISYVFCGSSKGFRTKTKCPTFR